MSQQRTTALEGSSQAAGRLSPAATARLVERAAEGDARAWEQLVTAYVGLVWAVARSHRLGVEDAVDAVQVTWLRLAERLGRVPRPERLGTWLASTARDEAVRLRRRSRRELAVPDLAELARALAHELGAVEDEEGLRLLGEAFLALPARSQALLRLLVLDPPPSYGEIGAALGMPVGSIGPTRGRCLRALGEHLDHAGPPAPRPVSAS